MFKTEREFLTALLAANVNDDFNDYAKKGLAALDDRNEKRKNSKSAIAHRAEVDGYRNKVYALFTEEKNLFATAEDVGRNTGESTAKASNALTALVKAGKLEKEEIKIHANKSRNIKGKKVNGYRLAKTSLDNN